MVKKYTIIEVSLIRKKGTFMDKKNIPNKPPVDGLLHARNTGDYQYCTPEQIRAEIDSICLSLGLNPATQPIQPMRFRGSEIKLYATRDCAEQLRKIHGVSVTNMETQEIGAAYVVKVSLKDAGGRTDISSAAVPIGSLSGDALANALMKCETKAKRRGTLSICGLGFLDESEIESIPGAARVDLPEDGTQGSEPADDWPPVERTYHYSFEGMADREARKALQQKIKEAGARANKKIGCWESQKPLADFMAFNIYEPELSIN